MVFKETDEVLTIPLNQLLGERKREVGEREKGGEGEGGGCQGNGQRQLRREREGGGGWK